MKKLSLVAVALAGLGTSGCVALLGAGAGAAAVACTADEVDCPPTKAVEAVEGAIDGG